MSVWQVWQLKLSSEAAVNDVSIISRGGRRTSNEKAEMEILLELVVTALISFIVAFLLAKLLPVASVLNDSDMRNAEAEGIISQERYPQERHSSEKFQSHEISDEEVEMVEYRNQNSEYTEHMHEVSKGTELGRTEITEDLDDSNDVKFGEVNNANGCVGYDECGVPLPSDRSAVNPGITQRDTSEHECVSEDRESKEMKKSEEVETVENVRESEERREQLFSDEDDWEGIEVSDLERRFSSIAKRVASDGSDILMRVGNEVQMQLYGLHKVATEGPCYEAQPSVLNYSARARWNAWHQLGSLSPEAAMEKYISLISEALPRHEEESPAKGAVQQSCSFLEEVTARRS